MYFYYYKWQILSVICYRNLDRMLVLCQDFDNRKLNVRIVEKSRPPCNVKFRLTISGRNSSRMSPSDTNQSTT